MKVAKRLKIAYVLRGRFAIPVGENIFQFNHRLNHRGKSSKPRKAAYLPKIAPYDSKKQ